MTTGRPARSGVPNTLSAGRGELQPAVWAMVGAQIMLIGSGIAVASRPHIAALVILAVAVGLSSGVFGLLAAHEMLHSRSRAENGLGVLMLSAVTNRHFRIAHVYGHHRWAATPHDPATARRGESLYAFLWRSVPGQVVFAYHFERRRLAGRLGRWWRHRLHQDFAIYVLIYGGLYLGFGGRALAFQVGQSAAAILVLGAFDYVAHYGLCRRRRSRGGYEPLSDMHSWNAPGWIGNWLLLDMGHHADHHRSPARPHATLVAIAGTPRLPGGYAGAIALALLPPLWRRKMHPRLECGTEGASIPAAPDPS